MNTSRIQQQHSEVGYRISTFQKADPSRSNAAQRGLPLSTGPDRLLAQALGGLVGGTEFSQSSTARRASFRAGAGQAPSGTR